jgi:hypothetical protein
VDEPFASRVNIFGGPSMARFHADGNDIEKDPKRRRIKDQLIILERIVEQMTDTMYQHGEKVEPIENEIGKMKHGFNEVVRECRVNLKLDYSHLDRRCSG